MKFIYILLFTTLFSFSQTTRLSVQISSCKDIKSNIEQFNELELYRNDSLVGTCKIDFEGSKQFENLQIGNYYIIVNTFFGKKKSETLEVKKEINSNIFLICADELDYNNLSTTKTIIDNLKNDEEIMLSYSYGGCFSSGRYETSILKKENNLYLKYNSKTKRLRKKQITILRNFFIEFDNIKNSNIFCVSTGNASIEIAYLNETKTFTFGCYYWAGFQNLEKDLKIKIKKQPLNKKTI